MLMIWLSLAFTFFLLELISPGLFLFLSFSVGAIIAAIASNFTRLFTLQLISFMLGTIFNLFISLLLIKGIQKHKSVKTNSEALLGKRATVIKTVYQSQFGQVILDGQTWSATSAHDYLLPVGAQVTVIGISGAHLIVDNIRS